MPVINNIQLFDGFQDNFLEWQYCPCDRFSIIGTSTDYMYLFTITSWYTELLNLVYLAVPFDHWGIVCILNNFLCLNPTQKFPSCES
jgi:hypothetical protein